MKNVLKTKNNLIFYFLILIVVLSCNRDKQQKDITLKKNQNIVDTTTGIFIKYPIIENIDYLKEENNNSILQINLEKIITKDSLNYFLRVRSYEKEWKLWNSKLIIFRNVQDYCPFLDSKLDDVIEKKFYKTPQKSFVVKFEYGSANVTWNYLYEVDNFNKKLFLKDIFYIEKYKDNLGIPQDTLAYLAKIKIDKDIQNIPIKKIDSLFNYFDEMKNKNEKWIMK